ncbi:cytochrome P450 2U1-like [Tubulanus polymorphus]|uniref:cytochrome P450 2U1-like n=1 Tax=Tubulanus polymorphus TaxID=672921 RepID=UPI003DA5B586
MDIVTILLLFAVCCLFLYFLHHRSVKYHLPPGPIGIPFLGYAPFVGKCFAKTCVKLSKRYKSDIISVTLGRKKFIILNSYEVAKNVLTKHGQRLTDRPDLFFKRFITKEKGIIGSDGEIWREQRHFTLGLLKQFGWGKKDMEDHIIHEVRNVLEYFNEKEDIPTDSNFIFNVAISNVISALVFGRRYDYDDQMFLNFLAMIDRTIEKIGLLSILNHFPWLVYFPGDIFKLQEVTKTSAAVDEFIAHQVIEHKEKLDENNVDTFIDAYLVAQHENTKKTSPIFEDSQMIQVVRDLFVAGSKTTAILLRWALFMMATYQDVQARVHEEIDNRFGQESTITLADRTKLPYTYATLMEIQRFVELQTLSIPLTNKDSPIKLYGYILPKETMVTVNLWAIHHDPDLWKNPGNFDPRNFLDDTESYVENREFFIPFLLGKRSCIGEPLAKMELFLFFASFMQTYRVTFPEGSKHPGFSPVQGIVQQPQPHRLITSRRK